MDPELARLIGSPLEREHDSAAVSGAAAVLSHLAGSPVRLTRRGQCKRAPTLAYGLSQMAQRGRITAWTSSWHCP